MLKRPDNLEIGLIQLYDGDHTGRAHKLGERTTRMAAKEKRKKPNSLGVVFYKRSNSQSVSCLFVVGPGERKDRVLVLKRVNLSSVHCRRLFQSAN